MSEFIWTEQAIFEFVSYISPSRDLITREAFLKEMEHFVASKQPKPEWEILEGDRGNLIHPWIFVTDPTDYTKSQTCDENHCKIHSVKRLSDGEVFSVGNWVKDGVGNPLQIEKFSLDVTGLYIHCKHPKYAIWTLKIKDITMLAEKQESIPVLLTPAQIEKLHQILNTL